MTHLRRAYILRSDMLLQQSAGSRGIDLTEVGGVVVASGGNACDRREAFLDFIDGSARKGTWGVRGKRKYRMTEHETKE